MAAPRRNRFGGRAGFGRGTTPAIRNVPVDIQVAWDSEGLERLLRDASGRFAPGRGELAMALAEAHRRMAVAASQFMVRAYDTAKARVGRPQHRTSQSHFRDAIQHPRNRIATPTGFGVGVPEWYDRSPARRYWRFIETGDTLSGGNPMEKVLAKGPIGGRFWFPGSQAPTRDSFRKHARFSWRYLQDIPDDNSIRDPSFKSRFHPNALLGTPAREDKKKYYAVKVRTLDPTRKTKHGDPYYVEYTLWFRKFTNAKRVNAFRDFDGYRFHDHGIDRFLAARSPQDVYRTVFGERGINVIVE